VKSVAVHGALLALALVVAFTTWTAEQLPEADRTLVQLWNRDPADLATVTFRSADRTVVIERRAGRDSSYLWGVETQQRPLSGEPVAPQAQLEQYPVSEDGTALFESLSRLRALRDLGEPDADNLAAYGLTAAPDTLTLRFRNGDERLLTVGRTVVGGGGHRYVLEATAGRVYVLSGNLFQPLEFEAALRLARIHDFLADDVRGIVLRAGETERHMQRQPAGEPPQFVWTAPDSDRPDQAFANFMEQLDRLWVARYRSDVDTDTLLAITRADYLDAEGDTLGTLELFRARAADSTTYFLRTRATIVPGEAYGPVAERIEQDITTLLGGRTRAD